MLCQRCFHSFVEFKLLHKKTGVRLIFSFSCSNPAPENAEKRNECGSVAGAPTRPKRRSMSSILDRIDDEPALMKVSETNESRTADMAQKAANQPEIRRTRRIVEVSILAPRALTGSNDQEMTFRIDNSHPYMRRSPES